MKNIHLLPTEKSSRLGYLTKKGKEVFKDLRLFDKPMPNILDSENQHIYITSDEEIKEGDWVCDIELNRVEKCQYSGTFRNWKKIILTTDQDLIAGGVQAIDDEFLEWFVKNPSCEFVKTYWNPRNNEYDYLQPQEESKQETTGKEFYESADKVITVERQETLEEAAEKYARKQCDDMYDNESLTGASWGWETSLDFIAGAKWQSERMYSEEEVMDMFDKFSMYLPLHYELLVREMFKKK